MNLHRRELLIASGHNTLKWCRPLTFLNGVPMRNESIGRPAKAIILQHAKSDKGHESNNMTKEATELRYEPYFSRTRRKLEGKAQEEIRGLTALVSFPGSGNTWVRYLLQQATGEIVTRLYRDPLIDSFASSGVLTGSIYKDLGLMKSGFPAESIANSSVLVVKTHEWGKSAFKMFSTAILLVRDPKKAIVAEFNRQSSGHVGVAAVERFKRSEGRCEFFN